MNRELVNHIQKYTTFEWLVFIKTIENNSIEEMEKIEKEEFFLGMLQNPNFHLILMDLALRLSDYTNTIVKLSGLPTKYDYRKFTSLYINNKEVNAQVLKDLEHSWLLSLSKYGYEQLKMIFPPMNDIGRLLALYSTKENLFKELFGLTPRQIIFFYLINSAKHDIFEPFNFGVMLNLLKQYDSSINGKKLKKFLDNFSLTIKEYRLKAKKSGIDKRTIKSERLIERFPIIDLNNNYYFIPSKNILQKALTYKVFENIQVQQSNTFKTKFGHTFEDYIRKLTKFSHQKYFYECDDLITIDGKNKSEFVLQKNNKSLTIEAKLLHFDENVITHQNSIDLKKKFKGIIEKALRQIESCFNFLDTSDNYGIIVIHTHIPLLKAYIAELNISINPKILNKVTIISVIDFEIMIDNPFEKMIEYLDNQNNEEDKHILNFFEKQENGFLTEQFNDILKEFEI